MCPYYSVEWDTLPHVIITSDTDWNPIVIDSTEAEDDSWFGTVQDSSKFEYYGTFDTHRDFVERNIFQDTEFYYFDANTYDEDYDFIIDSCVRYASTLQANEHNIISSKLFQIS